MRRREGEGEGGGAREVYGQGGGEDESDYLPLFFGVTVECDSLISATVGDQFSVADPASCITSRQLSTMVCKASR